MKNNAVFSEREFYYFQSLCPVCDCPINIVDNGGEWESYCPNCSSVKSEDIEEDISLEPPPIINQYNAISKLFLVKKQLRDLKNLERELKEKLFEKMNDLTVCYHRYGRLKLVPPRDIIKLDPKAMLADISERFGESVAEEIERTNRSIRHYEGTIAVYLNRRK